MTDCSILPICHMRRSRKGHARNLTVDTCEDNAGVSKHSSVHPLRLRRTSIPRPHSHEDWGYTFIASSVSFIARCVCIRTTGLFSDHKQGITGRATIPVLPGFGGGVGVGVQDSPAYRGVKSRFSGLVDPVALAHMYVLKTRAKSDLTAVSG